MKGLFCGGCKAKNNEEYREVLKGRKRKLWILFSVGIITAVVGFGAGYFLEEMMPYQMGLVAGFGTGLAMGAVIALVRIYRLLSNEGRLKEQRLKETDERELEVDAKALRATAKLILMMLYLLMIVGGLFYEEIMGVCCLLICIFLISYILFKKHYEKIL